MAKKTLPLGVVAPTAVVIYGRGIKNAIAGDLEGVVRNFTGYSMKDNSFRIDRMYATYIPIIVGFGVHWLATKLGINKALGNAKMPIIRL